MMRCAQLSRKTPPPDRPAKALIAGTDESSRLQTHVVSLLLVLVSLLVGGGLGLIRDTLLLVESLPSLTEELADLAERDAGVLLTDVLSLLVGKEHVRRKTTLGGVGV